MKVKLISTTAPDTSLPTELQSPEGLIAYTARVSSPAQANPDYAKLLRYCIAHGHWSVFEMVDMTIEITTSRAIAQQILRHRSFSFQEFSQRYAKASLGFELHEARRQDKVNRQLSIDDMPEADKLWFEDAQGYVQRLAGDLYSEALERGIAKEQARFLLPISAVTRLYMKGSVRSWATYLMVRLDPATQLEHRQIAEQCWQVFKSLFPYTSAAIQELKPEVFK